MKTSFWAVLLQVLRFFASPFVFLWKLLLKNWVNHAWHRFQQSGYLLLVALFSSYLAVYAVLEGRHERKANRAAFERAPFITMVSSNGGAFVAAMKNFGPIQMMKIPPEPEAWPLFKGWFKPPSGRESTQYPNQALLYTWVRNFLLTCNPSKCGRIDKSEKGKTIAEWRIDLSDANLRDADLANVSLFRADLSNADLREANLTNANLREANLFNANLREANLREAMDLTQSQLKYACVYKSTKLPESLKKLPLIDSCKQWWGEEP